MMETMLWERFELAEERINSLIENPELPASWQDFFTTQGELLLLLCKVYKARKETPLDKIKVDILKEWNHVLYQDICEAHYHQSYCNPTFCATTFGLKKGRYLATIAAEMRSAIPYAWEGDMQEIVIRMELLLELFTCCTDALSENEKEPEDKTLKEILYWYVSDYSEPESEQRVAEMVDARRDFALNLILTSDLNDVDYLYRFGEFITENEITLARYLNSLPEATIALMADTFTEGYRIGFVNTGKDLNRKKTVNIRYPIGMERVVRQAIRNFEVMGLKCIIYRAGNSLFRRQGTQKIGFFGANPNPQYDYDHKEDEALFLDGQMVTRKLECLRSAFEEYKEEAFGHAGPAVIEIFGETPFIPKEKEEAVVLSKEQQRLKVNYAGKAGSLTNEYIKGEERSFTIIAFPSPKIGPDFEQIFNATIRINTLEYKKYQRIQQTLIDTLDQACKVRVEGAGENRTKLEIALIPLKDAKSETKFENCVADVNIPVGEVFTSPQLAGTNGVLHVSHVYLNELEYKNLQITFKDGKITDYSCSNYDSEEQNRKYIKDNVLFHHETLPMGEFAIGTNTTAYVMARKFGIEAQLPILIAEKTGPHFAVGDTCYSHAEELRVYNPDGKEIISRDNEVSLLRKTNPEEAYFNCHTDVTIPYDELGRLSAVLPNGEEIVLIQNGRFVLPGTEELNEAFEQ